MAYDIRLIDINEVHIHVQTVNCDCNNDIVRINT